MAQPTSQAPVDVAIIGGGPAGAAVGALAAAAGHRVLVFERQAFPRFQIGESLVPAVNLTLAKLGVLERMDQLGFPRKHGVQFFSPSGPSRPFYFSEVSDPRMHQTWQVLRSDFDAMLLDNAVRAGAEVVSETQVVGVETSGERVAGVKVRDAAGERVVAAKVVVDASGQQGVLAQRMGGRVHIEGLHNTAVYAHYQGAVLDTGMDAGSTLIYRIGHGCWLWFIPLPDVVSIGLVAPARQISTFGKAPAEMLDAAIAVCEPLQARLASARRTNEVRAVRDSSYRAVRDGGDGWILVGDALGFIDPIYSTGLFLTMFSAELAADAISAELGGRGQGLAGYSKDYQAAFDRFLVLVRAFYQEGFRFGEFARDASHRAGLVDLLTGIVATPEAVAVARALADACDEQRSKDNSMTGEKR